MSISDRPGVEPVSPSLAGGGYALEFGAAEVARYRLLAEQARTMEADLWRQAGIVAGARVADVGCGPGALLPALADAVGPTGRVTGVDADPAAVVAARAYTADRGPVSVREGRAEETGLPPAAFDVVMLRHVLAHNGGREGVIVEHLSTLLRPGGCLYLLDIDGTAVRIMPDDDPDLADLRQRYLTFQSRRGNDVRAGLRLADLLGLAGLEVLTFQGRYMINSAPPGFRPPSWAGRDAMVRGGVATAEDVTRWAQALERLDAAPVRPTIFAPLFVAVGRRAG